MNTALHRLASFAGIVGLLLVGMNAQSVSAQDEKSPTKIEREIKVLVDGDGNVTVNGKPVAPGDEVNIDGETFVVTTDDDGHVMVMKKGGDEMPGRKVIVVEKDDGDEGRVVRRRYKVAGDGDKNVNLFVRKMKDGDGFEWHSDDFSTKMEDAFSAMDHAHMMRLGDGMHHDFEFDFDFDHVNPEIMKMESESRKLAREASRASGAERAEKERELDAKLQAIFDKKIALRQERIEKLQEKLAKERDELNERRASRNEIIKRRKAEIMGDDKLKW